MAQKPQTQNRKTLSLYLLNVTTLSCSLSLWRQSPRHPTPCHHSIDTEKLSLIPWIVNIVTPVTARGLTVLICHQPVIVIVSGKWNMNNAVQDTINTGHCSLLLLGSGPSLISVFPRVSMLPRVFADARL